MSQLDVDRFDNTCGKFESSLTLGAGQTVIVLVNTLWRMLRDQK